MIAKFITIENGKTRCWCETHSIEKFGMFMQYVLDNLSHPEDFFIMDYTDGKSFHIYKFMDVVKHHGMRKRTFDERIKNILTGNFA